MKSAQPTIASQRPNPSTGSHEAIEVASLDRHGKPLRNVCWIDNGFIGVDPIPIANVENFYKNEYRQEYKGAVSPSGRHVLRAARVALDRLRRIQSVLPSLSRPGLTTLDAGASSGEFVFLMKTLGHDALGIEAHAGYAQHARETLGLHVVNAAFSEFKPEGKTFDLITMFHVLEHLEFPVEELARLSASLSPNGLFAIEVPNILFRGMKFSHKWHRGHLSGFSLKTLEATAARAGLCPVLCEETGKGGNLFGIFKKGIQTPAEALPQRLKGCELELEQLRHNSNADYFLRPSTWLKLGPKLFTQIEERLTASRFSDPAQLLSWVYRNARA
jgi:2-polyprenyl-3-methyl-5-hydroxy-6-metoxy-1,4-benzoquinol methylase